MKQRIIAIIVTLILPTSLILLFWLYGSVTIIQADTFDVCAVGCPYTSIQEAVSDESNVAEGSVINVLSGIFTETVLITRSMTVQGQGPDLTIVDGNNAGTIFWIDLGVTVTIKELRVQNGRSPDGGGIANEGILTITNVIVQENKSPCDGGGGIVNFGDMFLQSVIVSENNASYGAGIYNSGFLTAENITVTLNSTVPDSCASSGGGIENDGELNLVSSSISQNEADGDGGGIENNGTLTVSLSTINDNISGHEGAGLDNIFSGSAIVMYSAIFNNVAHHSGGGLNNEGILLMENSAVYTNTANQQLPNSAGGGLRNELGGTLIVINSTVSDNFANDGGGFFNADSDSTADFINVTFYKNTSAFTGGIRNISGTISLNNTIIAHSNGYDCFGDGIISDGFNLDSDASCSLGVDDLIGITNPGLGPLQDNGGPTWTHELLPGSPAIDASEVCLETDQRGITRPMGLTCDIGAYEANIGAVFLPVIIK